MTGLDEHKQKIRMNVRNFLLTATMEELQKELILSLDMSDSFRAACVQELIDEMIEEQNG